MTPEVVRNMRSEKTHLAEVERYTLEESFGVEYKRPSLFTVALCGVAIDDGVVMRPGSVVRCGPCRHIYGKR